MPDQICLSLWLRDFDPENMLRRFGDFLRAFPFSNLRPGITALRIYALEFVEPGLSEQTFAEPVTADELVELAAEFQEPDCAYLIEGWWDLWRHNNDGWQLTPSPVVLTCFGPEFDNDTGEHIRLELGAEEWFLPVPEAPQAARKAQSNLQSIARLARELEENLQVERQKLWSDSGEDFMERLEDLADSAF